MSGLPPPPFPVFAAPELLPGPSAPIPYVIELPLIDELLPIPPIFTEAAPPAPPPPPEICVFVPFAPLNPYPNYCLSLVICSFYYNHVQSQSQRNTDLLPSF
jgi:hypothetical protein